MEIIVESTPATPTPKDALHYTSNPFTLVFDAFSKLFHSNAGWGVAIIILELIVGIVQTASRFMSTPRGESLRSAAALSNIDIPALFIGFSIVFILVSTVLVAGFVLQVFIGGMFAYVSLQSQKGHAVSFGEAFHAVSQRFSRLLLAQALAAVKILLWSLLFIVPGIVAALRYALLPYVIMDEPAAKKGIGASHDRAKAITKGKLMEVFGVGFAGRIVPFIGGVLHIAGSSAQYRQLAVSFDQKTVRPATHWLNYLAFIVFGVVLFLFASLGFLLLVFFAYSSGR